MPLEGTWKASVGDSIVGIVSEARTNVCFIDLSSFVRGLVVLRKYETGPEKGSVVSAIVKDVENKKTAILEGTRELHGGVLIKVKPAKIPRIIGKSNTMINQISSLTASHIVVGMNGLIWINGGNSKLAIAAIERIGEEAHVPGDDAHQGDARERER